MLKHSMFSNFYLNRRNSYADGICSRPSVNGSLAVVPIRQPDKKLVMCRATSRTWWESGWQLQR